MRCSPIFHPVRRAQWLDKASLRCPKHKRAPKNPSEKRGAPRRVAPRREELHGEKSSQECGAPRREELHRADLVSCETATTGGPSFRSAKCQVFGSRIRSSSPCSKTKSGTIEEAQASIRHAHVESSWLMASSVLLSHSSSCLLIAHVAPLYNSRSNLEKALYESKFHSIIYRYVAADHRLPASVELG
jgi:hypothetical protein